MFLVLAQPNTHQGNGGLGNGGDEGGYGGNAADILVNLRYEELTY